MTAPARWDAIVIGAGIVGAACARTLSSEGMRVLVIDSRHTGGGTTAAGMGHLVAMDDSPEQLALTALSLELWRDLAPSLPSNVEYDACGTIWVAENAAQMDAVREKQRTYAQAGIRSDILDRDALSSLEPNLRGGLPGGLLVHGDGVIYPPCAALWLLAQACERGATLRKECHANQIDNGAIRCGDEMLHADIIVNAAGAEAAFLTPGLPIVPRKGHLAISDRYPRFVRHQLVELGYLTSAHEMTNESVAFNIQPRATGQVLIGSSRELVGWDATINRRVMREMLDRALTFIPALADLSIIRTWVGFRPASTSKLPMIGRWEPTEGLWIAAGHEGLGITSSLGTARILTDLIMGRTPPIDALPFAPSRAVEVATA